MLNSKDVVKVTINLNSHMFFKIGQKGWKILLQKKHHSWQRSINQTLTTIEQLKKDYPIYKDGYIKMQIWEFMNIFGEHLYMGNRIEDIIEDFNIKINEEDIKLSQEDFINFINDR